METITPQEERYLRLLSDKFRNSDSVLTELINLSAILSLPKGTEHFVSDLHGAHSAFIHMIKNASGVVRKKVDEVYGDTILEEEKRALCALIYYPDERLALIHNGEFPINPRNTGSGLSFLSEEDKNSEAIYTRTWYQRRLRQVTEVARAVTVKYSRSKVRKLLPQNYAYIIEELLHESSVERDRTRYFAAIIDAIIDNGCADQLLVAMCYLIHDLTIDTLHIVGDIFDRGPGADRIMDVLMTKHDYDIQWGNHDIEWMGAAMGNPALIATVLRVSIRYANIETLEEGYGINLLPLANFAMETYGNDPCAIWQTKDFENNPRLTRSAGLMAKMHKAISIIQFKLEGQLIARHPEWKASLPRLCRTLSPKGEREDWYLEVDGKQYPMTDQNLPTWDVENPYRLTNEEEELMQQLQRSFSKSEKLQRHLRCLLSHGSLFLVRNGFLLYHAAIPLNADGTFAEADVCGERCSGRRLMERTDEVVRLAYYGKGKEKQDALDYMLYLWQGPLSPLYNKDKMTTMERYFVADKAVWTEKKGAYYTLADTRETCEMILQEFGLNPATGRIVNGHIPVRTIKGESPMRAEGRRFVIDGGFSKPYQEKTGISGYTLISNSHGIQLVEHESFESREQAIRSGSDIHSRIQLQDYANASTPDAPRRRILIRDTDKGREMLEQIESLKALLACYRSGSIKER